MSHDTVPGYVPADWSPAGRLALRFWSAETGINTDGENDEDDEVGEVADDCTEVVLVGGTTCCSEKGEVREVWRAGAVPGAVLMSMLRAEIWERYQFSR